MSEKYKLTDETIVVYEGITLHRIQALRDFGDVKKGDLGGFVESEDNLSQNDNCWIYENAKSFGNASVYDDAQIFGNAQVFGNARLLDNAQVSGNAMVFGNAAVSGNAEVYNAALVYDNAKVFMNSKVYCNARVRGNAGVFGNARIYGMARVYDSVMVYGHACVYDMVLVYGNACICGDAEVSSEKDYLVFKNWWSSKRYFTWTRSNDMWTCGCFHGTGKELIEKAYKDSEVSGREYEHVVNYVEGVKERMNKK